MSDPRLVICPEKKWTKINDSSAGITTGFINIPFDMGEYSYRVAARDSGNTAPVDSDASDGGNALKIFIKDTQEELTFPTPADVYIRVRDANDKQDSSAAISVWLP